MPHPTILPDYRNLRVFVHMIDDTLMGDTEHDEDRKKYVGMVGTASDVRLESHPEYKTVNPDMYFVDFGKDMCLEFAPQELRIADEGDELCSQINMMRGTPEFKRRVQQAREAISRQLRK